MKLDKHADPFCVMILNIVPLDIIQTIPTAGDYDQRLFWRLERYGYVLNFGVSIQCLAQSIEICMVRQENFSGPLMNETEVDIKDQSLYNFV